MGMTAILGPAQRVVDIHRRRSASDAWSATRHPRAKITDVMKRNTAHDRPAQACRRSARVDGAYKINQLLVVTETESWSALQHDDLFRAKVFDARRNSGAAAALRLMIFDVDGVLTDGILYFSETGAELKGIQCARTATGLRC